MFNEDGRAMRTPTFKLSTAKGMKNKMERLLNRQCNPGQLSPLTLAFVGDAVFTLLVREQISCAANAPVSALHSQSAEKVNATAQSSAVERIMPKLSEEEAAILRRGRNAHTGGTPKNASSAEYHRATGLEALFGYLYLMGNIGRVREIYLLICDE